MEEQVISSTKDLESICSGEDNTINYFISTPIPPICKTEPCILGIDEAGRGPVLGPMVYSICYCPKTREEDLKLTGCADSKTLTEEKRENIFNTFCDEKEYIGWSLEVISPTIISRSMLKREKVSLNEISHNSAIGLVKKVIEAGLNLVEVYVDTVGPADKYQVKLESIFPELKITVANKADSTYPIVSAASICAKVTRDIALKVWRFPEIIEKSDIILGSGYPGDPETKKFLNECFDPVFGFPQVVRFSWSTAQKIIDAKGVNIDWEEGSSAGNNCSIKSFFKPSKESTRGPKHCFFQDRHLSSCSDL